jgi:hypothetical protein
MTTTTTTAGADPRAACLAALSDLSGRAAELGCLLEADPTALDARELGSLLNVVKAACDFLRGTRQFFPCEAAPGAAGPGGAAP